MMALALVVVPLLFAALAMLVSSNRLRPWLVVGGGAALLGMVVAALFMKDVSGLSGWIVLGPFARLVLGFVAVLFFLSSIYARGYLALHAERADRARQGAHHEQRPI